MDLFHAIGDRVSAGQPLYRIHADYSADLSFASRLAARSSGFEIGAADTVPKAFGEF